MTSVAPSPIGMGCAYLLGGANARAARRLVDLAFDRGVRHFDVAPAYGLGSAEATLGRALGSRRAVVTVATKVGLSPPAIGRAAFALRSAAAPLRAAFPGLARRRADTAAPRTADGLRAVRFDRDFVLRSVDGSLTRLRTDRLDILLLHEVRPEHVTDELIGLLQSLRTAGKVGLVGVAGTRAGNTVITQSRPGAFEVTQHSWNLLDHTPIDVDVPLVVTHRAIMGALPRVAERVTADPEWATRTSDAIGCDLADARNHAPLLLGAAVAANTSGVALTASRSRVRLGESLRVLDDARFVSAGARLRQLLHAPDAVGGSGPARLPAKR